MIYTFGHSTLSKEGAISALNGRVSTFVDVRSHPGSKWPQFRKEELEVWLPEAGFRYEWWPALGGWDKRHLPLAEEMAKHGVDVAAYARGKFPKQRIAMGAPPTDDSQQTILPCCRPEWTNTGLRDYSFFESLDEFLDGADKLIELGSREDIAIVCCEAVPWRCHRSMISDFLAARKVESYHILPRFRQKDGVRFVDGSTVKPHSKMLGNRLDRYEPYVTDKWKAWASRHGQMLHS